MQLATLTAAVRVHHTITCRTTHLITTNSSQHILRIFSSTTKSHTVTHATTAGKGTGTTSTAGAATTPAADPTPTGSSTAASSSSSSLPYHIPPPPPSSSNVSKAEDAPSCPDVLSQYEDYLLPHPLWTYSQLLSVHPVHRPPESNLDSLAYWTIRTMRFNFDWMSGWIFGVPNSLKAINRMIFLETVAGVPGSIAATLRHLASLRRMRRDSGWINTLLAEAENERMHLLTALQLRQPGNFMKGVVFLTQGVFFNFFFLAYLCSPRYCHRLVGYLEEQAVITYTEIVQCIDGGFMEELKNTPIPEFSRKYWKLPKDAGMRELILAIRADEDHHREGQTYLHGNTPICSQSHIIQDQHTVH